MNFLDLIALTAWGYNERSSEWPIYIGPGRAYERAHRGGSVWHDHDGHPSAMDALLAQLP